MFRRSFLKQAAGVGIVSLSGIAPSFLTRAFATDVRNSPTKGRILVLVQMAGGNDGLNTVIPHGDAEYYKARPGIGIPKQNVLKIDEHLGLNPQLAGLKELYDEGSLAIVQGVGYPNPNRSHFRSMDIWESANVKTDSIETGWLGRAFDEKLKNAKSSAEIPALAVGMERTPLSLVSRKTAIPTVRDISSFKLKRMQSAQREKVFDTIFASRLASETENPELAFLKQTSKTSLVAAQKLQEVTANYKPAVPYPAHRLGQQFKTVAQLIAGEFSSRCYFLSLGGFDTHSKQQGAQQALLGELSTGIHAFFADLKKHKLQDRVLLATFSEFGRRVGENASLGTDHGAAAPMFVVSPNGKGGLIGKHPSLTDLTRGDLKHHTDFRSVYATILEKWMEIPSSKILGQKFPMIDFV